MQSLDYPSEVRLGNFLMLTVPLWFDSNLFPGKFPTQGY
jgi:hypothetical protein